MAVRRTRSMNYCLCAVKFIHKFDVVQQFPAKNLRGFGIKYRDDKYVPDSGQIITLTCFRF